MNRLARRAAKRASFEQQTANRANAQLSTGPVTAEGKAASSMNATKHGLTSMKPYLPAEEQSYLDFADAKMRSYNPQSPTEHELVATIIDVEWRLKRIPALEARLYGSLESDAEADPLKTVRALDTLSRHEARLRKLQMNTIIELHNIIQLRRKRETAKALTNTTNENGFVLQNAATAGETPIGERLDFDETRGLDHTDGAQEAYSEAA